MFWRANEPRARPGRRPSAKLSDGQTRTYTNKTRKQTRQREHRFSYGASDFLLLSKPLSPQPGNRPELVYFSKRCAVANKHCKKWLPSNSTSPLTSSSLSSPPPLCPLASDICFSPHISGQSNEPAAPQAAEITVEEAKSSLPGIHIVAALQWDRLRQISS